MLTSLQTLAARQLRELRSDVRLVVVHPNFSAPHTLVDLFGTNVFYLRFHGSHLTIENAQAQLQAALAEQLPDDEAHFLLDECDRLEPSALAALAHEILRNHASRRIIVFTRLTPLALLHDPVLCVQTQLIPISEQHMLWNYAERQNSVPLNLLEVYALGAGRVLLNGRLIESWDGVLPRALFFYLIDRGMVTRAEIFETFWPKLSLKEATNVFHVTKRKINEVLKTDLTVYLSGYYHIAPHIQLSYDVSVFNHLVQEASIALVSESANLFTQALALYRGDFLNQMDMDWITPRREDARAACADAYVGLGRIEQERGDNARALYHYHRAVALHPTREDVVESMMHLYIAQNQPAEALRCYQALRVELQRLYGVQPAKTLQNLAAALGA